MSGAPSLRLRLIVIILAPLLLIGAGVGTWQIADARAQARDLYDRNLLSTALAISRDVALSGGDVLSPDTRDLIADTSGGTVFYHVYAPDGVFVTGYATPPVPSAPLVAGATAPVFYDSVYLGRDVRALRFLDAAQVDGIAGLFTITVWQDSSVHASIERDLTLRSLEVIVSLVATVAVVVWFGVALGLRPLLDLQSAISERSSNDLRAIKRPVPDEVRGIVGTLNRLFDQVDRAMEAHRAFISNAAHQLRNPLASVLAMADAVHNAPDPGDARKRSGDLLSAAREASDLGNQLLTLERASAIPSGQALSMVDLNDIATGAAEGAAAAAAAAGIEISCHTTDEPLKARGDAIMLREAMNNLIANALSHGGPTLSRIDVATSRDGDSVRLSVTDDGRGIATKDRELVLQRFGQVRPGNGSGLGLPIAAAVAESHDGALTIEPRIRGAQLVISLPCRFD